MRTRLFIAQLAATTLVAGGCAKNTSDANMTASRPSSAASNVDTSASTDRRLSNYLPLNYLPLVAEPITQGDERLIGLSAATVNTPAKAENAALGCLISKSGLGADEVVQAHALYRVGPYHRLGNEGDWIWEVQVIHGFSGNLDGIIYVNSKNGATSLVTLPSGPRPGGG